MTDIAAIKQADEEEYSPCGNPDCEYCHLREHRHALLDEVEALREQVAELDAAGDELIKAGDARIAALESALKKRNKELAECGKANGELSASFIEKGERIAALESALREIESGDVHITGLRRIARAALSGEQC